MDRQQKTDFVSSLRVALEESHLVVVTHQAGLTVPEVEKLRADMREAGASFKVVKNTLAKIAVDGTRFSSLSDHLKGPTALAYSADPVAAAKVAVKFMEGNEKLSVVAGVLGEVSLSEGEIKDLAKLPSLDELRAQVLAVISTPARQLATVVNQPGSGLARVISAYVNKD